MVTFCEVALVGLTGVAVDNIAFICESKKIANDLKKQNDAELSDKNTVDEAASTDNEASVESVDDQCTNNTTENTDTQNTEKSAESVDNNSSENIATGEVVIEVVDSPKTPVFTVVKDEEVKQPDLKAKPAKKSAKKNNDK